MNFAPFAKFRCLAALVKIHKEAPGHPKFRVVHRGARWVHVIDRMCSLSIASI